MNPMKRAVSNILTMRDPNPSLPALQDQLERDLNEFVPRFNDPEATAQDADAAICRHNAVSTAELQQMREDLLNRTDSAVRLIDDLISVVDNTMAEAAAKVRAEMDRVNRKIEALKAE